MDRRGCGRGSGLGVGSWGLGFGQDEDVDMACRHAYGAQGHPTDLTAGEGAGRPKKEDESEAVE
jgi:hypothetical protein